MLLQTFDFTSLAFHVAAAAYAADKKAANEARTDPDQYVILRIEVLDHIPPVTIVSFRLKDYFLPTLEGHDSKLRYRLIRSC